MEKATAATTRNAIPIDAPVFIPSSPLGMGDSLPLGIGATGRSSGMGWRSCSGRAVGGVGNVGDVVGGTKLGAVVGDAEGAEVGSDVDGIAVIVGSVVMVGIALPVGIQVAVGAHDEVGTEEMEGNTDDDEGDKEVDGERDELGEMLVIFALAGANSGVDDPSFKGEGATEMKLLGAFEAFVVVGVSDEIPFVVLTAVGDTVGISVSCNSRPTGSSQWGPVKTLSLQAQ